MDLLFVLLILVTIMIFILMFILKNNIFKKEKNISSLNLESVSNSFPLIQVIENNEIVPLEKNKITDDNIKNAIATIDNILPKTAIASKNIKNSKKLLDDSKVYFSALKEGTENMLPSKNDKVYGIQMVKDKNTNRMLFNKQTEFTKEQTLIKEAGRDALVNAGFNVTSLIVGQYYMAEINNKLENIENSINEISNFLESEYQGKIMYIVSKLKEMIDNKVEILNNSISTKKRYDEIIDLERECTILLGQANDKLNKSIPKENVDFKTYEASLKIIKKWLSKQQLLQRLLLEINNLRYVLASGNESSKLSYTQYNNFLEQSNLVVKKLKDLHSIMSEKYGIDIQKSRRIDKLYNIKKNTIGKIKEDWAYQKIDDRTIQLITTQTNIEKMIPYTKDKQNEVIKIQKYNGEYYNILPDIDK